MTENINIKELLEKSFSVHRIHEQLDIVIKGGLVSPLSDFVNQHKIKNKQYTRHFSTSNMIKCRGCWYVKLLTDCFIGHISCYQTEASLE